ncbi:MAG: BtpA/SgcQ family protein [Planctomycetaceae bacterium]|nr:BtpA/SgcQ family protein [Planctomycetaceae bacterium]
MLLDAWKSVRCPLIGMLHLPPLPGSPRAALRLEAIRDHALRDAESLTRGGIDGMMLENYGDVPFPAGRVETATVAAMKWVAREVRSAFGQTPLGINVLRNDGLSALAIAHAVGANFIRVNVLSGARLTDQGIIQGIAYELLRQRSQIGAMAVKILADVDVKHSVPLASRLLADEAADLVHRALADGLIVTGRATGQSAALSDVREVKGAAARRPVFVGSGVTVESAGELAKFADGMIVGSWLKFGGDVANPVDPQRVRELVAAVA